MRSNKYPGKCEACGEHVAKHAGGIVKSNGRWLVYHPHCGEEETGECSVCGGAGVLGGGRNCQQCDGTGAATVAQFARRGGHGSEPVGATRYSDTANRMETMTRNGWRGGYEHTGSRCEDAPCCGCCD